MKQEERKAGIKQWIYLIIWCIACILFVCWTKYYLVLILIPFLIDIYITKFIPWNFWRKIKNRRVRKFVEWIDAIVFALVGVYIINTFFFQNYQIPSSSLEKSLLVGDFLCVSKLSYGARSPMTLFSFPLMQHTFPILGCKSYLEKPQIKYQRFTGTGILKRNDIVVFNYPSGDTVATKQPNSDYYILCKEYGWQRVNSDKETFGNIVYRPTDRRENYVKRCIGLPGETLSLRNDTVYINGKSITSPTNMQLMYVVQTNGTPISPDTFDNIGMSDEDKRAYVSQDYSSYTDIQTIKKLGLKVYNGNAGLLYVQVFLSNPMVEKLKKLPNVLSIIPQNAFMKRKGLIDGSKNYQNPPVYPINYEKINCEYGDFPSIWIPKKGSSIKFDSNVDYKVATYERCIKNYEHNQFEYKNGKVYINGHEASSYTFQLNYYFMMGDNRDNSEDSRYWGFVPEDHIVGKPLFIWLSLNQDKGWFNGKIRWNRIFTTGNKQ